jgi:predicted amidohydrolase
VDRRILILEGGRIIYPASGCDGIGDIAFGEGTVIEIGSDLPGVEPRSSM